MPAIKKAALATWLFAMSWLYRREDFIRIRDEYRAKLKALKQREAA